MSERAEPLDPAVGLCSVCGRASPQRNARGNVFWRCRGAEDDPRLLRYPPLPVQSCHGFRRGVWVRGSKEEPR